MLELNHVQVKIGDYQILRNVTLQVPPGQIIGLVGHNGAGKTTTLRSIMGLVNTSADRMTFEGKNLLALPSYKRARLGIGYVPEDRRLISNLTAEENILLPAWATGKKDSGERLKFIYELMPEVQSFSDRKATQLSGGQQKLLALARALMNGRKILLLDEPFEGVAPSLAARLGTFITSLKEVGLSVLLAESDPRFLSTFASQMYTIERGAIINQT
jgi:branched-chain amino acid transport system ATP-binding protein